MATEPQRFTRGSATELEALNLALVKAGAVYHTRRAGIQDPATPMVRGMLQMQDVLAWIEVAVAQDRQRSRNAADRARGIPKRSLRAFGYEVDGMTIRESEAVHIREAVRAYLAGEISMTQIAQTWTAAGIRTDGMSRQRTRRDGKKHPARDYWTTTTVRQVLLRARNAGILTHAGAELPVSQIQPIITRSEYEELHSRIKTGTPVTARAKSALGGIIECECGEPMHMTTSYSQRKGGPRNVYAIYKCSQLAFKRTRPHASIQCHIADEATALQVITHLGLGTVTEDEAPDYANRLREIAERLTILSEQEARAEDALVEGLGDPKRMKGRLEAIRAERQELREQQTRAEADRVGGNVFRVIAQMREVIFALAFDPDQSPLTDLEEWALQEIIEAWNNVPDEDQQALVRGRFRVQVRVGGRGAGRVSVEPKRGILTP
jgi:DNA invertase Pin-like site-specific DNA recombinase